MKKFISTIILVAAFVTIPLSIEAYCSTNDSELFASNDEYTPIAEPRVFGYNPFSKHAKWFYNKTTLYRNGGTYYLKDGSYYYPVHRNTDSTVDGRDVSNYTWKCKVGDTTYWFDY